ncbi:hypothetical protein [Actinacidiphila epipremni]|uniref:Uncharacterized protein n=1 Tax=Actinacidiphila epipremni TaxID=2053013 RepID=A0ABX0ZIK2_9ACTN|nr:hypothetical protein [Actinacidiphila epipremni]NJP42267.1 hypothetical protein [Actinacidiphila epipremni]
MLVRQLPAGARTRLAQGDADGLWGLSEHLTALLIDEVRVGNWQRANEGAKKSQQSKPPRPIARPGIGRRNADKASPERQAKRADARRRAAERRAAIARGDIT